VSGKRRKPRKSKGAGAAHLTTGGSLLKGKPGDHTVPLTAHRSLLTQSPKHPHHTPTPNRRGR
jgi:hypothetical protein